MSNSAPDAPAPLSSDQQIQRIQQVGTATGFSFRPLAPPGAAEARKIEYALTLADYAAFFRVQVECPPWPVRHDGQPQHSCKLLLLLFLLSSGALSVVAWFYMGGHLRLGLYLPFGFFLLFLYLWDCYNRLRVWWLLQRVRRRPQSFDPRGFEISSEAATVTTPAGTFSYRWHAIELIVRCPGYAYFYISGGDTIIVPQWAYVDGQAFEDCVITAMRYQTEARRFVRREGQA
jgi:hypothetical protein